MEYSLIDAEDSKPIMETEIGLDNYNMELKRSDMNELIKGIDSLGLAILSASGDTEVEEFEQMSFVSKKSSFDNDREIEAFTENNSNYGRNEFNSLSMERSESSVFSNTEVETSCTADLNGNRNEFNSLSMELSENSVFCNTKVETSCAADLNGNRSQPNKMLRCEEGNTFNLTIYGNVSFGNGLTKGSIEDPDMLAFEPDTPGGNRLLNSVSNDLDIRKTYLKVFQEFGITVKTEPPGDVYSCLYEHLGKFLKREKLSRFNFLLRLSKVCDVSHLGHLNADYIKV